MKRNFKERVKSKKGVTLIALVITIIVLLILTGVTIAMLTGENGIVVNYKNSASGKVPVSKAKVASWNLVNQTVAKAATESMYNAANSKVKSKLVDSYAWDTTCKWLKICGIVKEESTGKMDSTNYENYNNSKFTISKGTSYVKHLYLTKKMMEYQQIGISGMVEKENIIME